MNSTEDPSILPPPALPGVLDDQLALAIRAYGRRQSMLTGATSTLRTLLSADQRLLEFASAVRYYGQAALSAAAWAFELAQASDKAGAAFVWLVVEQILHSDRREQHTIIEHLLPEYPLAVHDALWFANDPALCRSLVEHDDARLHSLGVEVAGRLALQALVPAILRRAQQGADIDACTLACVRMGRVPTNLQDILSAALASGNPARQALALDTLAIHAPPSLGPDAARLLEALAVAEPSAEPASQQLHDAARMVWTLRSPDVALSKLLSGRRPLDARSLRTVALTGRIEGLLALCSDIDAREEPPSVGQVDALRLLLGAMPLEWQLRPEDMPTVRVALRRLVAEVLQRNGCTQITPEHLVGWDPDLPRRQAWPAAQLRLRHGKPQLRRALVLADVLDHTHAMRRWLYAEQAAALGGQVFALSWLDGTWRQTATLNSAAASHELSGQQ